MRHVLPNGRFLSFSDRFRRFTHGAGGRDVCARARGYLCRLAVWLQKPIHTRLRALEPQIRNAIVPLVCLYICIVAAVTLTLDSQARTSATHRAMQRAEFPVRTDCRAARGAEPPVDLEDGKALAALLPDDATHDGRTIFVLNDAGSVLACAGQRNGARQRGAACLANTPIWL